MKKEPNEFQLKARLAHGKNLAGKCVLIAKKMGDRFPKKHGANMVFAEIIPQSGKLLRIRSDTYVYNLSVTYGEEWVLSIHSGTLKRFIPDTWMLRVVELYKPLKAAEHAENILKQKECKKAYLENFGF